MGFYFKPFATFLGEAFEYIFAGKEKRHFLKHVPKRCRNCDVLGICRDKNNQWRCKRGCLMK